MADAAANARVLSSVSAPAGERPFHRGGPGPLYWSTYGYSNSLNTQIPEAVWKANIDWIAKDLAPYGYRMVCTDGWIDGDQDVTPHGYIKSLSGRLGARLGLVGQLPQRRATCNWASTTTLSG